MTLPCRLAVAVLPLFACAAPASAVIDGVYFFGDSLSDVGNVQAVTSGLAPLVPPTPGPFYFQGRFSNGANFTETLAGGLGLTSVRSGAGGNNYAFGGARSTGTGGVAGAFINDVDEQVSLFRSSGTVVDAQDLFVIYAGANDLNADPTSGTAAVASLRDSIQSLYNGGARQVLAPNLPGLGLLPRNNGNPVIAAAANAVTLAFNAQLEAALVSLEQTNIGLKIFRLDVAGLFASAVANPGAFGLTNVTAPAAPGLEPGETAATFNPSAIVSNPDEYLFWDDLHPTRRGHAILGQAALQAVGVPEPTSVAIVFLGGLALLRRRCRVV